MSARNHLESESRNRNLSAAVLHVKPSRHDSNLYDSRENHHKVEILNYSVSRQYRKQNRDFITINFRKFSFFQGVFSVLKRYIGSEPWDLFPLTIECYRKCLQNYTGTLFFFLVVLLTTKMTETVPRWIIHWCVSIHSQGKLNVSKWRRMML